MPNRRYHIHVVCADNEQPLVLDSLAIFFQARAFLTYDVSSKLPQATLYGRQCIDACDYTLIIIGDSYGTAKDMGVSQMHLSYLNAKAKLKPLLILIKIHHEDADVSRQLQDFTRIVQQQAKHVYYYDMDTNIEHLLIYAYENMVSNHEVKEGWVRISEKLEKSNLQTITAQYVSPLSTSTAVQRDSSLAESSISDNSVADNSVTANSLSKPLKLIETFTIQYSAQAYEGGNLSDITRMMTLTWQEVLHALAKMPGTFSSYSLQSCINRLVTSKADQEVKQEMPNVHAVSRCRIAQSDLNKLQHVLVAANWIQLTTYGVRVSQEMWKLTFYVKNLFEQGQPKALNKQ